MVLILAQIWLCEGISRELTLPKLKHHLDETLNSLLILCMNSFIAHRYICI